MGGGQSNLVPRGHNLWSFVERSFPKGSHALGMRLGLWIGGGRVIATGNTPGTGCSRDLKILRVRGILAYFDLHKLPRK